MHAFVKERKEQLFPFFLRKARFPAVLVVDRDVACYIPGMAIHAFRQGTARYGSSWIEVRE